MAISTDSNPFGRGYMRYGLTLTKFGRLIFLLKRHTWIQSLKKPRLESCSLDNAFWMWVIASVHAGFWKLTTVMLSWSEKSTQWATKAWWALEAQWTASFLELLLTALCFDWCLTGVNGSCVDSNCLATCPCVYTLQSIKLMARSKMFFMDWHHGLVGKPTYLCCASTLFGYWSEF